MNGNELNFLVYSMEHGAWWKKNKFGYTRNIESAGIFSIDEAIEICNNSNRVNNARIIIEEMLVPITPEIASYFKK